MLRRKNKIATKVAVLLLGFLGGIVFSWWAAAGSANSVPTAWIENGWWAGYRVLNPAPSPPDSIIRDLLWETEKTLRETYLDPDELNEADLLYGAIRGLVGAAGDPYTSFFTPEEAKQFLEDASGHFEGIGAEIGIRDRTLTIISPLPKTPARRAGLESGDLILEIDGKETRMMSLEEAVSRIRGRAGTQVLLKIFREGEEDTREIKIIREKIEIPTLDVIRRNDGTVLISLFNFSSDAPIRFRELIGDIVTAETNGIILDLRGNPGGFLDSAVEIGGLFLSDREVIVIERQRDAEDVVHRAEGNGPLRDTPTIILVDGGSASAAEILAGALRDNRDILLVGEDTFGKGTVQEFPKLTGGGGAALKVTVGEWLTPNMTSLREKGLVVDIEVSDDPETAEDEMVEAAAGLLLAQ